VRASCCFISWQKEEGQASTYTQREKPEEQPIFTKAEVGINLPNPLNHLFSTTMAIKFQREFWKGKPNSNHSTF
jgi:hypothetical protein